VNKDTHSVLHHILRFHAMQNAPAELKSALVNSKDGVDKGTLHGLLMQYARSTTAWQFGRQC
jgi:hypothetical protein